MRWGDLEAGRLMSEPLMGFDSNRKWRVGNVTAHLQQVSLNVGRAELVRRAQWERALLESLSALATIGATADDAWSRDYATAALRTLRDATKGWVK